MSSISAGTTTGTALVSTGDTTGTLVLKTNGSTTAVTIGTDQAVVLAGNLDVTGNVDVTGTLNITGATTAAAISMADNLLTRSTLKDYAIEGSAIGNAGASRTFDLSVANFFSVTIDQATTFTFSNPPASGDFGCFVMEITNGAAFVITFPASVDWPGGSAPSLTASGKDQLVFTTRDAGTTWFGFVAGLDIKSP